MNTEIISISKDQNTITHKSGTITIAKKGWGCNKCCYYSNEYFGNCLCVPCLNTKREDKMSVIFEIKEQ